MYFKLRAKIFVCCICLASEIFALEIDDYKYKRVKELNDKIVLDPETFLYRTLSAIQCISKCALVPNCESVFYFQSSCKGYSVVYSPCSSNLTLISGARYYVNTEEPTEETITERNADIFTTRNAMLGKLFFCKQLLNLIHFNLE